MAGIDKSISLRVIAQIKDYEREIAKLPAAMQKEARLAGRALSRELIKEQVKAGKEGAAVAKKTGAAWSTAGKVAGAGFAAAAAASLLAGKAVLGYVKQVNEARIAQIRLSDATGINRETLAGLEQAFRAVGADSAQVTDQLQDFNEKLFDFGAGGGAAEEALEGLGIKAKDVRDGTIGADEALRLVLDRLPRVTDETKRAAFAQQLFSDRGLDVVNAMNAMPLDDAIRDAERYGRVVDEDAVKATERWNQSITKFSGLLNRAKVEVVDATAKILPAVDLIAVGLVVLGTAAEKSITLTIERFGLLGQAIRAIAARDTDALGVINERLSELADENLGVARAALDAGAAFGEETAAARDGGTAIKGFVAETNRGTAAATKASAAVEAQANAIRQLEKISLDARSDLVSDSDAILFARNEQLKQIEKLRQSSGDDARAFLASEMVKRRAFRDTVALRKEGETEAARIAKEQSDEAKQKLIADYDELQLRAADFTQSQKDGWSAIGRAAQDTFSQSMSLVAQLGAQQAAANAAEAQNRISQAREATQKLRQLDDRLAGRREKTIEEMSSLEVQQLRLTLQATQRRRKRQAEQAERLAIRGHQIQKGAAIAQAFVQAPANAVALTPAFVPIAGPLAPAAATAAALAQLGIQVAAIQSAPKPSFHGGGLVQPRVSAGPDAIQSIQRPGEFTSTPGAVANAGGPAALAALERGPMSQRNVTNFFLNDRLIDTITERSLAINGGSRRRVRRQVEAGEVVGMARVY